MKRAALYILMLGIACTGVGVAAGVTIEKSYTRRHLPQVVRKHFFSRHKADPACSRAEENLSVKKGRIFRSQRDKRSFHQQRGQKPGQRPESSPRHDSIRRLGQRLNLSAEQEQKVKAVLEATRKQVDAARDKFKAQIEQAKEKSNARILELLGPEQKEKFEQFRAKREQRRAR
jgi:hypothetical protein